jgi:hypothetical protein
MSLLYVTAEPEVASAPNATAAHPTATTRHFTLMRFLSGLELYRFRALVASVLLRRCKRV